MPQTLTLISMKLQFCKVLFAFLIVLYAKSQSKSEFPMLKLPISDWQISTSKWQTASDIQINPENSKKIKISSGNQILIAQNGAGNLTSTLKTGDVKLKFDFLLGEGSENVFYLMGRYGIVLNNSYGKTTASVGSIVRPDGSLQPSSQNACRATGLWQNIEIVFSAKSKNSAANIEKVVLNGITLHENYLMVNPSQNAPLSGDSEKDSFIISNISGLIAIKNIEYLSFGSSRPISISDVNYEVQETYDWDRTFEVKNTPLVKGKAEGLTVDLPHNFRSFIVTYNGKMKVDKAGTYAFTIDYMGVGNLTIDGKQVAGSKEYLYRVPQTGIVELSAGIHDFSYKYQRIWWRPALGLFVSSGDFRPYALHPAGLLPEPQAVGEIDIKPTNKFELIRSFMMFEGKKRTHVISVGSPAGVHYSFDLNQGTPLYFWRGNFADVTEMWFERGEPQLLKAKGLINQLSGKPNVFQLKDLSSSSPDSLDAFKDLVFKGYQLDNQGNPTFSYELGASKISQKFSPQNNGILHEVEAVGTNLFVKISEGKNIVQIDKELYLVDNQYIKFTPKSKPIIRESKNGKEMLLSINGKTSYQINW